MSHHPPVTWMHFGCLAIGSYLWLVAVFCTHMTMICNAFCHFWQKKCPFRRIDSDLWPHNMLNDHSKLGLVMWVPQLMNAMIYSWNSSPNCNCHQRLPVVFTDNFLLLIILQGKKRDESVSKFSSLSYQSWTLLATQVVAKEISLQQSSLKDLSSSPIFYEVGLLGRLFSHANYLVKILYSVNVDICPVSALLKFQKYFCPKAKK